MSIRLKKFIGMIMLVVLVVVYALVAMAVSVPLLAEASSLVRLLFFIFSGLLWIVPAMVIIRWMVRMNPQADD